MVRRPAGDRTGAEQELREALALRKALLGENHLDIAETMLNLGIVLREMGRYDDAEPVYREAVAVDRKTLGEAHPQVVLGLKNLVNLFIDKAAYDEMVAPSSVGLVAAIPFG